MLLYEAVTKHDFSETICFLCGAAINESDETKEHVFPKWLLQHFKLWDRRMTLMNGTLIPYRSLVIPCCKRCNNEHLSELEIQVKRNFIKGASALREMDRKQLMLWVIKIFYGLLYRELFLPIDRCEPQLGTILTKEIMEQYQLLHYILQATRVPITFSQVESDIPASIFVFELQEPKNQNLKFDYKDDIFYKTLFLQMGKVDILASFDMGAQNFEGKSFFPKYQNHALHPIQFGELGANLFLKAKKFNRVPKIVFSESPKGINFSVMPIGGLSTKPVFDNWTPEEKAEMLMFFLNYPEEAVMPVRGMVPTWLTKEDGSFYHIDINVPPWSLESEDVIQ